MAASKLNYLVMYKNHSQVYGCSSKKTALDSPPPEGFSENDKNIFFITLEPDSNNISLIKINNKENENGQEIIE